MTETEWTAYARKHLVGRTIKGVWYMTKEEAAELGWSQRPVLMLLDNGTVIYPSQDDEGNDAGTLFGQLKDTTTEANGALTFPVL